MTKAKGKLICVGLGPGDPELVTLKAVRRLREVSTVAYVSAKSGTAHALKTLQTLIDLKEYKLIGLIYPETSSEDAGSREYRQRLNQFYDSSSRQLEAELKQGIDVCFICAGDPMLYASISYWLDRLKDQYPVEVIPGVSSIFSASAAISWPLALQSETLMVCTATLSENQLTEKLRQGDTHAILKIGRHAKKLQRALKKAGRLDLAVYVELASQCEQRIVPFKNIDAVELPYFSLVLVPSKLFNGQLPV